MRNDALDELDSVPSLTTDARDRDFAHEPEPAERNPSYGRGNGPVVVKSASTGPLWALVGALVIALGGLGWWSHQQIELMSQQLVATQESFARISEEAAGRIQDISGKVVATESSVTSGSEALRLKVKQLENKVAELSKQQQSVSTQQNGQGKRVEQLAVDLKAQQDSASQLDGKLKSLAGEQIALKAAQDEQAKLDSQLKSLGSEVAALKKLGNPNPAISRLEQDLLVLKSEQENRSAANNTSEFDAFRAQMTRNISTLQSQVLNLQQQLNAR
ncbi:ATPase [Pseudomonas sp. 2FE]|uniref:ATPase n=1 Tax=Pseudomonas sp. 2FE TaxID=2502190 RepID=UPI0010F5347A|nr:ATPase [Pseudomonas sp. 2FE]